MEVKGGNREVEGERGVNGMLSWVNNVRNYQEFWKEGGDYCNPSLKLVWKLFYSLKNASTFKIGQHHHKIGHSPL